jgi:cation transport ATPase
MHDVHRDSIIHKKQGIKKADPESPGDRPQPHAQDHNEKHNHMEGGTRDHNSHKQHDGHDIPHGHDHKHEENKYEDHDSDLHIPGADHSHHDNFEDHAMTHMHEHAHSFYHRHHHTHHPEHTSLIHRILLDQLRDWFAVGLMGILIFAGYYKLAPGHLSDGMIICAAVIGIFPMFKNGIFDCVFKKKMSFELLLGIFLIIGLLKGYFLETALISVFLLVGSFFRLNFSWK